jgi:hypothetical protein
VRVRAFKRNVKMIWVYIVANNNISSQHDGHMLGDVEQGLRALRVQAFPQTVAVQTRYHSPVLTTCIVLQLGA